MPHTITATGSASANALAALGPRNRLALPLIVVAVVYFCIAMHSAINRLLRRPPMTPWESTIIVESWRVIHGQPVYTDPATGHATLMYGPLAVFANVPLVAMFGPDVRLPRVTSLLMTLTLCIAAAWLLSRRGGWMTRVLILSFCFLHFYRMRDWGVEARPDAAMLLFSLFSLALFYRSAIASESRAAVGWMLFGTAVMLIGLLFKQTAAVVGVIPVIMVLLTRGPAWPSRLAVTFIPIVAVTATMLALKLFWPWVHFYMFTVPRSYGVPLDGWATSIIELFRLNLLSLAALFGWVVLIRGSRVHPIDQWLLVTATVMGLFGAAARAKFGGYHNSHLPAMIALGILAARALPDIFQHVAQARQPQRSAFALAVISPLLLIADISTITGRLYPGDHWQHPDDAHYKAVISRIQRLKGRIVCLDDPTIPLLAKSYPGHTGQCELDANAQTIPITVRRAMRSADWYIQVISARGSIYSDRRLADFGFERADGILPKDGIYILWRRSTTTTRHN